MYNLKNYQITENGIVDKRINRNSMVNDDHECYELLLIELLTQMNKEVKENKSDEYNKGNYDYESDKESYELTKKLIEKNLQKIKKYHFSQNSSIKFHQTNDIINDLLISHDEDDCDLWHDLMSGYSLRIIASKYDIYNYKYIVVIESPRNNYFTELNINLPYSLKVGLKLNY